MFICVSLESASLVVEGKYFHTTVTDSLKNIQAYKNNGLIKMSLIKPEKDCYQPKGKKSPFRVNEMAQQRHRKDFRLGKEWVTVSDLKGPV